MTAATMNKLLKYYDDYLYDAMRMYADVYSDREKVNDEDYSYLVDKTQADENELPMSQDNVDAMKEDYLAQINIDDIIASFIADNHFTDEDKRYYEDEEEAIDAIILNLQRMRKERDIASWPEEMPEFVYRGVRPGKEGLALANENYPNSLEQTGKKLAFVSSEPSVAASYARRDSYDRFGVTPSNLGTKIYRIRTAGLDPKKFIRDKTSTFEEAAYGPQYMYKDDIPQEKIIIKDQAGNDREVDRFEQVFYRSDALCKDIVAPPHIIDGVRKTI